MLYTSLRPNPNKFKEFIPDVIFYNKNFIILGEDHNRTVYIKDNKVLLNKWLYLIKDLAKHYGIYFEGCEEPQEPVTSFLNRYLIKGKYKTWDTVPLSDMEYLVMDTFGGDFKDIKAAVGNPTGNKTLVQVLSEKSSGFTYDGHFEPEENFKKLIAISGDKKLIEELDRPYSLKLFKEYHAKVGKLAFDIKTSKLYQIQVKGNLTRGKNLRKLCESHGGLFFVGSSHINIQGARQYGLI